MIKLIITNLVLSILGVIVAFGGLELIARLKDNRPETTWNDRPTTYFVPESSSTLQDYPHKKKKPSNTYRIAAVGDSFTFGPYLQFDDTFPKRLERFLNLNDTLTKAEVINYGVPRYSTSHEILVVKKAIKEEADLIILQITLNDPEIKPYFPSQLIASDRFGQPILESGIFKWSHAARFIASRYYNLKSEEKYKSYFLKLFNDKDTWSNFKTSIEKIASSCQEANKPVVAVVFPLFGLPADDNYPFYEIHQKISALLSENKIKSLDLLHTYDNIPLDRLVVIPGKDRHPNEIANRMAAEAIYKWLIENNLIPKEIQAKVTVPERIGVKIGSYLESGED